MTCAPFVFWVPGDPLTERKRNYRSGGFNRTVDTKERTGWKKTIAGYLMGARSLLPRDDPAKVPLSGPLVVTAYVVRPSPEGTPLAPTVRYPWPWAWLTRPDGDNYAKLAHDAMNKLAYRDDAQIVDGRQVKLQWPGAEPGILIVIRPAEESEFALHRHFVETRGARQ